jgi:hypothetical protein
MDAAPHLGTATDLEMRTARVADPALGGLCVVLHPTGQHPPTLFLQI